MFTETVMVALTDSFNKLRSYKGFCLFLLCVTEYIIGLSCVTQVCRHPGDISSSQPVQRAQVCNTKLYMTCALCECGLTVTFAIFTTPQNITLLNCHPTWLYKRTFSPRFHKIIDKVVNLLRERRISLL